VRRFLSAPIARVALVIVFSLGLPPATGAGTAAGGGGGGGGGEQGYWLAGADGSVYPFGSAASYGSLTGTAVHSPVAGLAATPTGHGYWLAGADGGIFAFGDARFLGSMGAQPLNRPIVGMASTATGNGYWFVASDGGLFAFGDAGFLGSMGAQPLNRPIVGMAATPSGHGYWLVASDGGLFAFGDAGFYGSTGNIRLNQPIVGMTPTPSGHGYWFVASDGGIFNFGDAGFYGSTGDIRLNQPIVGMTPTPSGHGYWFVASDGGIFNFGDAGFWGSAGEVALPRPVIAMSAPVLSGPTPNAAKPTNTSPTTETSSTTTTATTTRPSPPFDIALIGDTGYSAEQDVKFQRVIEDMNRHELAFVVHDGDIKAPDSPCGDARYTKVRDWFDHVEAPFVYAPGDNEWMDCADPPGRLAFLRNTFFPTDQSLGERYPLTTQRARGYPENARWARGGVVFATLNLPGPNDNIPSPDESGPRRLANLDWLRAAFDTAQATGAPAVMIVWQADPFNDLFDHVFSYLMDELKRRAIDFGKPVVLVHGDTHIYTIDNPWPDVGTFTRVETHALVDPTNWIRVTVNPADPKVFTFHDELAG
jgi:ribosomal protein L24E